MDRTARALADMGLQDRYGFISGVRGRVAQLLIDLARDLGEHGFRQAVARLTEAVIADAKGETDV